MKDTRRKIENILLEVAGRSHGSGARGDSLREYLKSDSYKQSLTNLMSIIESEVGEVEERLAKKHLVDCLRTGICEILNQARSINLEKDNYIDQLEKGKE